MRITNPNVKYVTSFSPNSRSHWVMPGYRATYLPFGLVEGGNVTHRSNLRVRRSADIASLSDGGFP
jgi:hypothetical protein